MKIRFIAVSLISSLVAFNAHAFSTFNIQYPEGKPQLITVESKYSTGKCSLPSTDYSCQHTASTVTFQFNDYVSYLQSFIREHSNKPFAKDPLQHPNNYIKLSIPGQSGVCHIDLNAKNINVNLRKNGSC